jgi:hypothetical protein
MVRIAQVDVTMMDRPPKTKPPRELTPAQRERQQQQRQFEKLMTQLRDEATVFEVRLGREDKAVTVRQRLLRAAQDAGKEVAVRKSERGFVVGLMTPERRSNRGRKRASTGS